MPETATPLAWLAARKAHAIRTSQREVRERTGSLSGSALRRSRGEAVVQEFGERLVEAATGDPPVPSEVAQRHQAVQRLLPGAPFLDGHGVLHVALQVGL